MPLGTRRMVQIKEMFELYRFGLGEVTYKSLLRLFHGESGFVRIREMFELGGVELERVHCSLCNLVYVVYVCNYVLVLVLVS